MLILIKNAQRKIRFDLSEFRTRAEKALKSLNLEDVELSILLAGDAKIQELNYNYRDKDQATDVLSFPQDEEAVNENGERLLGDIAISLETAQRQAEHHGLNLDQEAVLLLIHGILHLLGYDHETSEKDHRFMKQETARVFGELFPGVSPSASCNF